MVGVRPPRLAGKIERGSVADAFLAAQVEQLCIEARVRAPRWTRDPAYILPDPWFAIEDPLVRAHLLRDTPAPFKNRNVFTTPEIHFRPKRGRPRKTHAQLREANPRRVAAYRARQKATAGLGIAFNLDVVT